MKVGLQTILWGRKIEHLDYVCEQVSKMGYQGLEFAQAPGSFGIGMDELVAKLAQHNLQLIGLAGGSMRDRLDYCEKSEWCKDLANRAAFYFYADRWNEKVKEVLQKGFRVALHPHALMNLSSMADVRKVFESVASIPDLRECQDRLLLLPDTAHLTIAGDDPLKAIAENWERLAAVHLKDWTPQFGRNSHRYARGFTTLGNGIAQVQEVAKQLVRKRFGEWVIVEQDNGEHGPLEAAQISVVWLSGQGLVVGKGISCPSESPTGQTIISAQATHAEAPIISFQQELRFHKLLADAASGLRARYYAALAEAFYQLIPCKLIQIWLYNPTTDNLELSAYSPILPPDIIQLLSASLPADQSLAGRCLRSQTCQHLDIDLHQDVFQNPELKQRLGLKGLVALPVGHPLNVHHTRLLVSIYLDEQTHEQLKDHDSEQGFLDCLNCLGEAIAQSQLAMLSRACDRGAGLISYTAAREVHLRPMLDQLSIDIQQAMECDGVSIFLAEADADRLEMSGSTALTWHVPEAERFYEKGDGAKTTQAWQDGKVQFLRDCYENHTPKSEEKSTSIECLFMPMTNVKGQRVGVVRCRGKKGGNRNRSAMFSHDDLDVLDTMIQHALPHLAILQNREQELMVVGKLTHELNMPLTATRASLQFMRERFEQEGIQPELYFDEDYLGDAWCWTEVMKRNLKNAEIYKSASHPQEIQVKAPVYLMGDVIAPIINHFRALLKTRGLEDKHIHIGSFADIPAIFVDKHLFQQVCFNLLANAIKYAPRKKASYTPINAEYQNKLEVEISAGKKPQYYVLRFRDWGPGIPEGWEKRIFESGTRAPGAESQDAAGQGIGLHVVKRIVEAHNGRIRVSSRCDPTEFEILLPQTLSYSAPPNSTSYFDPLASS